MTGAVASCRFGFITGADAADAAIESEFHFVQIILLHRRLAKARTVTLSNRQIALYLWLAVLLLLALAAGIAALAVRYAGELKLPLVRSLLDAGVDDDAAKQERYMRENLNAMAVKLGEMQARLMRLDALGDRVSGLAGINPQEFDFKSPPARGGLAPTDAHALTMSELRSELDRVALDVEHRSDFLNAVETELINATLKSKMMPTIQPVDVAYNASGFGWRLDPFTGTQAMHQGIDFVAATGTPIVAAAGGVVIASEWHHDFGNMVEIDHGNDNHALCPRVQGVRAGRRHRQAQSTYRRCRIDRARHRPASALRSARQERGAEPRQVSACRPRYFASAHGSDSLNLVAFFVAFSSLGGSRLNSRGHAAISNTWRAVRLTGPFKGA